MFPAQRPFLGQKIAAKREGTSSSCRKPEVARCALDVLGLILGGDVEGRACPGIEVLKGGALALPVGEVAGRNAVVVALIFDQTITNWSGCG